MKDIKIILGNNNPWTREDIDRVFDNEVVDSEIKSFSDGEISVSINETVRSSDVFVIQSTSDPINDSVMELLIIIDALKRASASRITAVMPYFGYARQDRKTKSREPITAKLVANLITKAGADRVLTMDLHELQMQGFFDIPLDNLWGSLLLAKNIKDNYVLEDAVVVSPDIGSVARSRKFAEAVKLPLVIVDKRKDKTNERNVFNVIGDVEGKDVFMVDDIIDTGETMCNAAKALVEKGANKITVVCTHPVLSKNAASKIYVSDIDELITLDTIKIPEEKMNNMITKVPAIDIFADAIHRIHNEESIGELFL